MTTSNPSSEPDPSKTVQAGASEPKVVGDPLTGDPTMVGVPTLVAVSSSPQTPGARPGLGAAKGLAAKTPAPRSSGVEILLRNQCRPMNTPGGHADESGARP